MFGKSYKKKCRELQSVSVSLKTEAGEDRGEFHSPSLQRDVGNVGNLALRQQTRRYQPPKVKVATRSANNTA
jgi:hypothetical protein